MTDTTKGSIHDKTALDQANMSKIAPEIQIVADMGFIGTKHSGLYGLVSYLPSAVLYGTSSYNLYELRSTYLRLWL
jgi:hypothetical protein